LKTILKLLKKDLLRDSRHPWGIVILMLMPVLTAVLISMVFSPQSDIRKNVVIRVAVLDRDDDLLSGLIRSMSNQGDATENIQLHFVETVDEGIRLLEKRKVSALVVLPEDLTVDLLKGEAMEIALYKNPAETVLPVIVEEGLEIVCIGVSQALGMLGGEITTIREMLEADEMPEAVAVAEVASDSVKRLRQVEPYLFPPLVQFETVDGGEYLAARASVEDPNQ
jgi:hypothetical protein